jgi:hypothetical protein
MPYDSEYLSQGDQKALSAKNLLHFHNPAADGDAASILSTFHTSTTTTTCTTTTANANTTNEPLLEAHLSQKANRITSNIWPRGGKGKELRQRAVRSSIYGVEIRILDAPHILAGQTGLFAARPYRQYDFVGEYCGEVLPAVNPHQSKFYQADIEEKKGFPLRVDGQRSGNECRAINHYENIAKSPSVIFSICYVEELPRLMIICKRDIAVGEELLLDYGSDYVKDHFQPKQHPSGGCQDNNDQSRSVDWAEMAGEG